MIPAIVPALIPLPTSLEWGADRVELPSGIPVGPPEIVALLAELGVARAMTLSEVDDDGLGFDGYRLVVDEHGLRAEGSLTGLRWAAQTIRQLLTDPGPTPYCRITDVPRYSWRGSLLDVARWHQPEDFLYRYVDAMAMHKLNRLHLHLTDDQGWRFEVRRYPRLTEIGAYRTSSPVGHAREGRFQDGVHGGWYSQKFLKSLVAYAARRGVEIMPEIDIPGHMQAAISAYPHLGNNPTTQLPVRAAWGISSHVLNVADETVAFVRDVLDELVEVFPFEYVHIGGDEVPATEWLASPAAADRARDLGLSDVEQLLGWWTAQMAQHLARHDRRIGAWDEVLDHGVAPGTLIFGWRDATRAPAARAKGFEAVNCAQEYTYFDWSESLDPGEPLAINGPTPLAKVYALDPGDVTGVQGQLWCEYHPIPQDVEYHAFPRLCALAEVAWGSTSDYPHFEARLAAHLPRLDALGVRYRPIN